MRIYLALLIVLVAVHQSSLAGTHTYQLSGDSKALDDVGGYHPSPDGNWIVYTLGPTLYSKPTNGGAEIVLNSQYPPGYSYLELTISPDSRQVIFTLTYHAGNLDEISALYSVPIAGGPVVKLTSDLYTEYNPSKYRISADSKRVVYIGNAGAGYLTHPLWSVPIQGGKPVRLTDKMHVTGFQVSPDGQWVVYTYPGGTGFELHRVAIGGGTPLKLVVPSTGDEVDYYHLQITPDGKRVIYQYLDDRTTVTLRSVPIGGGPETIYGLAGSIEKISPDSRYIAYLKTYKTLVEYPWPPDRGPQVPQYINLMELYCVPLGGGPPVRLHAPMTNDGTALSDFSFTPDSQRVLFRISVPHDGDPALYSAPVNRSTPIALSGLNRPVMQFRVTPDSRDVFYLRHYSEPTTSTLRNRVDLYKVPVSGGITTRIFISPANFGWYDEIRFNPDGTRVLAYIGWALFSIPRSGGPAARLDSHAFPGLSQGVKNWSLGSDGQSVFMLGDLENPSAHQIYRNGLAGGTPTRFNQAVYLPLNVLDYNVSPDGKWVAYRAEQDTQNAIELYCVPTGGGTTRKLCPRLFAGQFVQSDYQFSSDSRRIVFRATPDRLRYELYSTELGSGSPVLLSDKAKWFEVAKDASRAIFQSNETDASKQFTTYTVRSVPLAGGTATTLIRSLSDNIKFTQISPDSQNVFYMLGNSMFSIPLTGGLTVNLGDISTEYLSRLFSPDGKTIVLGANNYTKPMLLSVPVTSATVATLYTGRTDNYAITADSRRVIFNVRTYVSPYAFYDIYSVPIRGGTLQKLTPVLDQGLKFFDPNIRLSPDSKKIVIAASNTQTLREEKVYILPVGDGSIAQFSLPLIQGDHIINRQFSPDSKHLASLIGAEPWTKLKLYVSSMDGSLTSRIADLNIHSNEYAIYRFSGNGQTIAFRSDGNGDGTIELHLIPVMGGSDIMASDGLAWNGASGVQGDFWVNNDGSHVIYRVEQGSNGVNLFATTLSNSVNAGQWMNYH